MSSNPKSTAAINGHPIHHILVVFPVAFWIAALATDITYANTGSPGWATASLWLVGTGVVMALVAALAGFTDFFGDRRIRDLRDAWQHMIGNLLLVTLSAISWGMRYTQGAEEAVMPWGLMISALVTLGLLYTGWKGGELAYRHRVGVMDTPAEPSAAPPPQRARERERA